MTHLKRLYLTVITGDDLYDNDDKAIVEQRIRSRLPDCDVTIHFLPSVD